MSDNFLRLIPIDPYFIPERTTSERAYQLFKTLLPDAYKTTMEHFERVQFIDPGSNFEDITCTHCGSPISVGWWIDEMNKAYEGNFLDLSVELPCCHVTASLNELRFSWPAGFARFVLEAMNPGADLTEQQISLLGEMLGTPLRKIWAHY